MFTRLEKESAVVLSQDGFRGLLKRLVNKVVRPFVKVKTQETKSAQPELLNVERTALKQVVDQLPSGYRAVFILHDVYGYSHEQIAEKLGISVGVAKSQLHIARIKVRALLIKNSIVANTTASCREMLAA